MRNSLLVFAFILIPNAVFAQVAITEVMYDLESGSDSGREWIEVLNTGTTPVPLTTWKLFENGTNHKITPISGGAILAPDTYAVIATDPAKFKADWPQFSGQLFRSAFSLSNTGETIALRNASSTDVDIVSYQSSQGAAGDGNSLNRSPGGASFVPRTPTPGSAMSATAVPPPPPKQASVATTKTKAVKAVIPKRSATRSASNSGTPAATVSDSQEADSVGSEVPTTELAAASAPSSTSYLWWAAAAGLALLAAASIVAAKRFGKKEWDIVEEKGEEG